MQERDELHNKNMLSTKKVKVHGLWVCGIYWEQPPCKHDDHDSKLVEILQTTKNGEKKLL